MKTKNIVILTGAGISAESGIQTFRDAGGLWEGHNIYDVATPEAWIKNPTLVLDFYNKRRAQLLQCNPNDAHKGLVKLEKKYKVDIITQNVDDLHERAGSKNVLHLHGELKKSRSTIDKNLIYNCENDINIGNLCEKNSQLRPHIVWFGEDVPMIEIATELVKKADIFVVIGTSMVVYPAAGLINYSPPYIPIFIIDPNIPEILKTANMQFIKKTATSGVENLLEILL